MTEDCEHADSAERSQIQFQQQITALETDLRQRGEELSTLYNLAEAIGRDPSINSILHNTLSELTRVSGVPFASIYVKDDGSLTLRSYRGYSNQQAQLLAELDFTGSPQLSDPQLVQERLDEGTGRIPVWQKALGIQARISAPLLAKNEVIGLIRLASQEIDHFTAARRSLIRSVATQIAMALANARLYELAKTSEEKYRSIVENLVVGLYQSSPEGKFLTANPALVRLLGYESVESLLAADIPQDLYVSPEERELNLNILQRTGRLNGAELRLRGRDGREITVLESAREVSDAAGNLLYYEGTLIDITEMKSLERQLLQAQKMESIGTLVGGIAHDFNNMLTGIWGYTQLALQQVKPSDPIYENLCQMEVISQRASDMVSQLLAFSRKDMGEKSPISLHPFLKEIGKLLERMMPENIEIRLALNPEDFTIEANPGQLHQVLMNLVINARDAMPQGGRLGISTSTKELGEVQGHSYPELAPGRYVVVSISDTGTGISQDVQTRMFDPFYTTKEEGKGTGLGLSVVYGIVKNHGGMVQVDSQVGSGTTFHIYLPIGQKVTQEPVPARAEVSGGTETILLMEDERTVLRLAQAALEYYGYRVLTAKDGVEGMKSYQENSKDIALVILDIGMPKMSGREVFRELKKLDPSIKILLATGYSPEETVEGLLEEGALGIVRKPYQVRTLAEAVRKVLGAESQDHVTR